MLWAYVGDVSPPPAGRLCECGGEDDQVNRVFVHVPLFGAPGSLSLWKMMEKQISVSSLLLKRLHEAENDDALL